MTWNYSDEESLIEHIRKLQEKQKKEMLEAIEGTGYEDAVEVEDEDEDEDEECETYVKYIVIRNRSRMRDFDDLQKEVNKFIENQSDSFILEGPVQVTQSYIVQTLINEDEM